ncbi:zinc-dependent alcohol dehydrogenase family protein [Caulobacter sp. CCH9-E1]|jgi:NADPH2:quinone reductase|uniref:zinc-dependent alcohol dehydrogenase family protein n=1 Tax=Caulobacter sp. CCH9-E1 TaxID=1768768 RepID=UPI00082F738A|nr:zinc-dependent alcohol dehydrogenase family protein [Caulobacter sp. CCH9-E1]
MSSIQTMTAAVVTSRDGPFTLQPVARPTPGPGEVLVRVEASGLNPLDLKIRAEQAAHARNPLPAVLGMDLAGEVEAVAADVVGFAPGDRVFGLVGGVGGLQGAHAQYVSVDAGLLAKRPVSLSARAAAALPLVAITAWEGLVDRARVRPGQTVLVQGGAGGVGHLAVQIALAKGARVYATALGEADQSYLRDLGAVAIDGARSVADYVGEHTAGAGFEVVYDTGGGALLDASFQAVKRFGHVVSCLGWGVHALAPLSFKQATYSGVFTLQPLLSGEGRGHFGEILTEVAALADQGALKPRLHEGRFGLDALDAAYETLAGGRAGGKVVVDVAHP